MIHSSTQTTSPLFKNPHPLSCHPLVDGWRRIHAGVMACEVVRHREQKRTDTRPHPARWARETALIPDQHRRSQFARLGARFVGELPTRSPARRGQTQAPTRTFGFVRHPEKPPSSRRPVRGKWPVLIARSLGASAMDQRTVLIPDHPRTPGAGTHTQERRHGKHTPIERGRPRHAHPSTS